jgi:hypothetical protein
MIAVMKNVSWFCGRSLWLQGNQIAPRASLEHFWKQDWSNNNFLEKDKQE